MIASRLLSRAAPRAKMATQQKRGFLDYLTNYPDKVSLFLEYQAYVLSRSNLPMTFLAMNPHRPSAAHVPRFASEDVLLILAL